MKLPRWPHHAGRLRPALTSVTLLFTPLLAAMVPTRAADAPGSKGFTPTYSLTDLGSLGASTDDAALAINDRGDAVGSSGNQAFLYHRGRLINLGALLLPNWLSSVSSINLEGQAVGYFFTGAGPTGFLYDDGRIQTLTGPNGEPAGPAGINNFGQVVGTFLRLGPTVGVNHVFVRQPTGQLTDLGTFGGTESPIAGNPGVVVGATGDAINDLGQIAGSFVAPDGRSHAFLAQPGGATAKDLGTLGGGSAATALNDFGQVIGTSAIASTGLTPPWHAFLYSGGQMHDLGTLPGAAYSVANGINLFGQVVGVAYAGGPSAYSRGFVYLHGQMHDLNDLLSPVAQGWQVVDADGINDWGQIVGSALDAAGAMHAVILTPQDW